MKAEHELEQMVGFGKGRDTPDSKPVAGRGKRNLFPQYFFRGSTKTSTHYYRALATGTTCNYVIFIPLSRCIQSYNFESQRASHEENMMYVAMNIISSLPWTWDNGWTMSSQVWSKTDLLFQH
jgi:hypothetical protein